MVQTTGRRLYELFGYGDRPDDLCDVKASADVMCRGMRDGTFTGKTLKDYFNASTADGVNARQIVNGTDRADIAAYAKQFHAALQGAA